MTTRRFTQWVALACIGTLAACTSGEGGTAGNTEINVIVPTNAGTPDEIDIQTVEYTIACAGNSDTFLDNAASFDDAVRIDGNLEVTDVRTCTGGDNPGAICSTDDDCQGTSGTADGTCDLPTAGSQDPDIEIWQGFRDLPPGPCSAELRARDNDGEVICTATQPFNITADVITKVNILLMCKTSFQAPVGSLDVDGTFSFNVGNFCPDLFVLNCTDTDPVPQPLLPPPNPEIAATTCEVRFRDGDSTCGNNCDPQVCKPTAAGLSCSPAPDPNPACPPIAPATSCKPTPGAGVSTTITCTAGTTPETALLDCEGDGVSEASCTLKGNTLGLLPEFFEGAIPGTPVACDPAIRACLGGPASGDACTEATALSDCFGAPCAPAQCLAVAPVPGVECIAGFCDWANTNPRLNTSFVVACAPPGPPFNGTAAATITCTAVTTDGDNDCDKTETVTVTCPGLNFCDEPGTDCDDGNECTTDSCDQGLQACVNDNVPAGGGSNCSTAPGGGLGECDGAGNCADFGCSADTECGDGNECTDDVCNVGTGACSNPPTAGGTVCDSTNGLCDGAGVCVDNCTVAPFPGSCDDGDDCTQNVCTSAGGAVCSNPFEPSGTLCDAGGGNTGACDGAGSCIFIPTANFPLTSKDITVGCSNNVTGDVSILTFTMDLGPFSVQPTLPFSMPADGVAAFTESFLDAAQAVVPGGVQSAQLFDLAASVAARSGATGSDLVLGADVNTLSEQCELTGLPCTGAPGQGNCTVIPSVSNLCQGGFATIPVINGTPNSAGGCTQAPVGTPVPDCDCSACEALDQTGCRAGDPDVPCLKGDQCALNGFCVNGDLPLELQADTNTWVAGKSGETMLFGWHDGLTPPVTSALLSLPPAVFANPTPPVGLRVSAGGLFVALQCLQAEDSGLITAGVATCLTGPNIDQPCNAPFDNSNNACNDGTDAGLTCSQSSITACTSGTPATIGCVNADCGSAGGIAHECSPPDLAANTPDAALIPFLLP